jgi:hypothetical protein
MKVFEWSIEDSSPFMNKGKYFTCSQIVLIVKQIWFDIVDSLHAKMFK